MERSSGPEARQPTLLDRCARAATAAETRFRVDYPNSQARAARVVALDEPAAAILEEVSREPWRGARFFVYAGQERDASLGSLAVDARLRAAGGGHVRLADELADADLVVMVAGSDRAAEGASVIGDACAARGIMTAALVVAEPGAGDAAVSALRPHAAVLVVTRDADYVPEMLSALRA